MRYLFCILLLIEATLVFAQMPQQAPVAPPIAAWTDRRPIAQLFVSQGHFCTPVNPDGYLSKQENTTTPEGRATFRQHLLDGTDRWIGIMKAMDAQGVIVWDLEGYQQRGMVYVGDPRVLPEYAPAMDAVADAFFQKFRDAGLRTGLCIRPNRIFLVPPASVARWGKWGYVLYEEGKDDVVKELSARIAYAKRRWGCTIFYIDTNRYKSTQDLATNTSSILPAAMLEVLHRQHPDVLLIPEHPHPGYHAWAAQYRELRGGWKGTPEHERAQYPGTFSVLQVGGTPGMLETQWEAVVKSVRQGDALFCDGWYASSTNEAVTQIYRQARYSQQPLPDSVPQTLASLQPYLADAEPARRFQAVRAIGALDDPAAAKALLTTLGAEQDWVVRKEIIVILGRLGDARAIDVLATIVRETKCGHRFFAREALRQIGMPALPVAQAMATSLQRQQRMDAAAIVAGLTDERVVSLLSALLADDAQEVRQSAATSIAVAPDARYEPVLLTVLAHERYWPTQLVALRILGEIGSEAAIPVVDRYATATHDDRQAQSQLRAAARKAEQQIRARLRAAL